MFASAANELFDTQKERMLSNGSSERVTAVFEFLERRSLDAFSIDMACCQELKRVLNHRYETTFAASGRLDGRGWSQNHIAAHMERFLRNKLRNASAVMRAAVCSDEPLTEEYLDGLLSTEADGGNEAVAGTESPRGSEGGESLGNAGATAGAAGSEDSYGAEDGEDYDGGSDAGGQHAAAQVRLASSLDDLDVS